MQSGIGSMAWLAMPAMGSARRMARSSLFMVVVPSLFSGLCGIGFPKQSVHVFPPDLSVFP